MSSCRRLPRHLDDGAQAALNEISRPLIAKHADCSVSCAMTWSDLPDIQRFQVLDNSPDPRITAAAVRTRFSVAEPRRFIPRRSNGLCHEQRPPAWLDKEMLLYVYMASTAPVREFAA
jgi:hypothetical protein